MQSPGPSPTYLRVGFNSYLRPPEIMAAPHRHNEVEFLYLFKGKVIYNFSGLRVRLPTQTLILFWSGLPHQVLEASPGSALCGIEIPLAWYMHWKLPERLNQQLLSGHVLFEADHDLSSSDSQWVSDWHADLHSPRPVTRRATLLEVEARLWRYASSSSKNSLTSGRNDSVLSKGEVNRIERMARYIAQNYTRPLHVEEVSKVVNLHPNYAMKLFRKSFGDNFSAYLNQFRVAHAQRLLSMSDAKVTEIGVESGFGSLSRFNSNFRRECGMSPRAYREMTSSLGSA
jgi:AraC-like DNA-binding protein